MRMETNETNQLSLPPNYVSLADLQQRWINQQRKTNHSESHKFTQEQSEEKKNTICESQKSKPLPSQGEIGVNDVKNREKEENGTHRERNLAQGGRIGGKDENPESQFRNNSNPNLRNRRSFGGDRGFRKGMVEYRVVKSNPEPKPVEMDCVEKKATVDSGQVGFGLGTNKVKGKNVRKKRGNGKGGGEATVEIDLGDRTVEVESKLNKSNSEPAEIDCVVKKATVNSGRVEFGSGHVKKKSEKEKGGGEATVEIDFGDRTVETEGKLNKSNPEQKPKPGAVVYGGEKPTVNSGRVELGFGLGPNKAKKRNKKKLEKEKGGVEATVEMDLGDWTVEIEDKLKNSKPEPEPKPMVKAKIDGGEKKVNSSQVELKLVWNKFKPKNVKKKLEKEKGGGGATVETEDKLNKSNPEPKPLKIDGANSSAKNVKKKLENEKGGREATVEIEDKLKKSNPEPKPADKAEIDGAAKMPTVNSSEVELRLVPIKVKKTIGKRMWARKGFREATAEMDLVDQTVEIEDKLRKMCVERRSRDVIERETRSYGRVEYRGVRKEGFKWVKKGETGC